MDGGATIIIVTLGGAMCGTSQCNMFGVYTTYWVRWAFFPHTQKTPENDLSRSRSQMIENDAELSVVKDTWVFVGVLEHNSWFIILLNGFCHPRPNSCWWWHQDSETHHIWHQNDDRRTETLNTAQKRVKRRGGVRIRVDELSRCFLTMSRLLPSSAWSSIGQLGWTTGLSQDQSSVGFCLTDFIIHFFLYKNL